MSLIACTSASTETRPASNTTVALFSIRLTLASETPGTFDNVRCTLAWHAAHVMPSTGSVMRDARGASVVAFIPGLLATLPRAPTTSPARA